MLSKIVPALIFAVAFAQAGIAAEEDYASRLKELRDRKADAQIEPLLNEWREKAPNDPEAWITSANYYFNKRQVVISTKPPGKDDFKLTDKKTGKQAGSISFEQDKGNMKRAADLLQEATTKFPDRLGIWCGLAFIYQESEDFDNELSTLKKMVAYAREHPAQLKWEGEPLKEPADKFIAEKLHSYGLYYEKKENPEDDKRWFQISSLAAQQYPSDVNAWIDMGGYYADLGEWKKAIDSFEKARVLNPKSQMILVNLARFSLELKDNAGARKYFEEGLNVDPNGPYAQEAKEALRKLKKK